ncbi:MAG: histidine ammonia-lyase, partial [candidate division WOR-3 bacterium]
MVKLNGLNLTLRKIEQIIVDKEKITLAPEVKKRIERSANFVERIVQAQKKVYGINTGFGALSTVRIPERELSSLQRNLLLSHNTGVGPAVPLPIAKTAMVLRLNTLIRGYTGVRFRTVKALVELINNDVIPLIPSKGSVGASGDLAPLAAMSLPLIGEGEVVYKNRRMPALKALNSLHLKPLKLGPKEGLALINGTQMMTAYGVTILREALTMIDLFDLAGAMSLETLKGTDRAFDQRMLRLRPYPGVKKTAANLIYFLRGSKILQSHRHCNKVQDAYSLRCMPQVHGAVRDLFAFVRTQFEIEINSVTDNPILLPEDNEIIQGGNFHGEPVAFGLDLLAIGLTELSSISERRIFRMLDPTLSGLAPFLIEKAGLNSGLMMLQTTAAGLVAQNKILSHPASIDSIPTSANQEDHVSMGMNAALKAYEVLENTKNVLAMEFICAAQGIDILRPLKSSPILQSVKEEIRKYVPYLREDRDLSKDIKRMVKLIDSGQLLQ